MSQQEARKINWQEWASLYDILRYPPAIYDELVIEKKASDDRFNLLGAWKTGCISATGGRHAYTDKDGTSYYYTKRWRADCPVGYRVWSDLARTDADVVASVPSNWTSKVPELVTRLCRRKGFGFIWAVFVLHCVRPKTFPLYDQHVYRAFRWLETKGEDNPNQAPASWEKYRDYARWFSTCVQESNLPYSIVDRALWTYGKSVKKRVKTPLRKATQAAALPLLDEASEEWVHETTFGGKKKSFWWMIDRNGTVRVKRLFGANRKERVKTVSKDEMDKIRTYMEDGMWRRLSNNVVKLSDGTERPGIGRFLVRKLGWTVTDAQLAGHLGVIMTRCGAWSYNGKKARIEHRRLLVGWRKALDNFYRESLADTTGQ